MSITITDEMLEKFGEAYYEAHGTTETRRLRSALTAAFAAVAKDDPPVVIVDQDDQRGRHGGQGSQKKSDYQQTCCHHDSPPRRSRRIPRAGQLHGDRHARGDHRQPRLGEMPYGGDDPARQRGNEHGPKAQPLSRQGSTCRHQRSSRKSVPKQAM